MPQKAKEVFAVFCTSLPDAGLISVGRAAGTVALSATGMGTARGGTGPLLAVFFSAREADTSGFCDLGVIAAVLKVETSFLGAAAVWLLLFAERLDGMSVSRCS